MLKIVELVKQTLAGLGAGFAGLLDEAEGAIRAAKNAL